MTTASFAQSPSSIYYTKATGPLSTEVGSFMSMYKSLVLTGQPHANAATFSYTDPLANTPMFDPLLASQRTVSGTLNFDEACPSATAVQIALHGGDGTITNDLTDTDATVNHLNAALSTDGVVIDVDGTNLVSQGIPPSAVSAVPVPAQAFVPSPALAAWIADIEWHAIQETALQNPAADVKNVLMGLPTNAQHLAWSIWDHLYTTQQDEPDDIRVLKAEFGIYGALPVLEVTFDQGFFLLDGLTGEAFGPYADGQPYDPLPLLSNHPEYQAGTPASLIVASTSCPAVGGARWRTNPPPNHTPRAPQFVQCPTPQNPNQICPRGPIPYSPPNPPLEWPEYPYCAPVYNICPPYPVPGMPGVSPQNIPWDRNPGVPGNPTDWSCQSIPGTAFPVEICSTITEYCPTAGGPCVPRIITCLFSNPMGPPPNRDGTPPIPGQDWPNTNPPPLTINPNQTPPNGNLCIDRFFY